MKKILLLIVTLTSFLFAIDAKMEIIKNRSNLPNIATMISIDTDEIMNEYDKEILELVKKDLVVSGHFDNIDVDIRYHFEQTPEYEYLKTKKIDLCLVLQVQNNEVGGLVLNSKLYDVNTQSLVFSKSHSTSVSVRFPFLSHSAVIDINKHLKAPPIDWMNKFVVFSRYIDSKTSEIVVSDYTLTYQKTVVKGGLNIFPKWANNKKDSIYYTTYNYQTPTLMKLNLYTGEKQRIISSDGMLVCSDVSKDGSKLLLTMAPNSQPDVYLYDTVNNLKTRITTYNGIDVGGSFVEDESKIVFVSDRLRYPNIFAKKIGKKGVERLIYHGRNNSQCSTHGDFIVYSSRETDNEFGSNVFNLYLISTYSDYVRRLTATGQNQFPKFSADGESILFIKNEGGRSYLMVNRINYNKNHSFILKSGKLQSIDW